MKFKPILVVTTLLLGLFLAHSSALASVSIVNEDFVVSIPDYWLTPDDIVNVDPQNQNGYNLCTYRVKVTPSIYFRNSGYVNGHFTFNPTFSLYDGQGQTQLQYVDIKVEGETILNDNFYTTVLWNSGVNNGSCKCFGAFNNFYVESSQNIMPFPSFWVEIKYYVLSENYRSANFLVCTSSDAASSLDYTNSPINDGLSDIITNAIVEALGTTSDTNSVVELLYSILIQEQAANITLASQESLLNSIISKLTSLQGYVDGIEGLLTQIYNKINDLYNNIDNLIDTITWNNSSFTISLSNDGLNWIDTGYISAKNYVYLKFSGAGVNPTNLYKITMQYGTVVMGIEEYFTIDAGYYDENGFHIVENNIIDYYPNFVTRYTNNLELYVTNLYSYHSTSYPTGFRINFGNSSYYKRFYPPSSIKYITTSDIEYWKLKQYFTLYYMNNMSPVQASEVAAIESAYESKGAVSESLAGGMSVDTHNFNGADINISGQIDVGIANNFNSLIATILSNGLIMKLFIIAITIATVSFILYGKKG